MKRFSAAKKDILHWKEYDYIFINDDLKQCLNKITNKINALIKEKKEKDKVIKLIKSFN